MFRASRSRRRRSRRRPTTCRPTNPQPLDTYGRSSNPTWRQLESALAELEGATSALAFGSGMAAITSVLRVLAKPGTTLVVPADGYYQVRRYAAEYLAPLGVTVRRGARCRHVRGRRDADVVLAETPVNPTLDVVDLHRLAHRSAAAAARRWSSTTPPPTPLGQQPLSLGADLVVASATKALSGHSDLLAGYVAGSHPELMAAVERERLLAGADPRPVRGVAGAAQPRQRRAAVRAAVPERAGGGADAARPSGGAVGALSRACPTIRRTTIAAAQMRRFGGLRRRRTGRRRRRARAGRAQRAAGRGHQLRRHPHLGGPAGPLGRPGRRRVRAASRWASRTPTTCSPTSSAHWPR